MSISTINQAFRVVSGDQSLISTLNGDIALDTAPSGQITLNQNTSPIINITEDGSVNVTAKDAQNIYLTTTSGGKTVINNLDYIDKDNVYKEEVTIEHDMLSKEITVVTPESGSYQLLIDGVVDDALGTSSDCSACIFMAKKKGQEGVVNVLCGIAGDQGEALLVTWVGTTITVSLSGGTLSNYTSNTSTFNIKLIGAA